MALLTWIVRTLVILLILRVVLRLLMPAAAGSRAGARRANPGKLERAGGALVRDPYCGTYVPQSRALKVGLGANVQYFCSAACRDAFAAAHDSVAS